MFTHLSINPLTSERQESVRIWKTISLKWFQLTQEDAYWCPTTKIKSGVVDDFLQFFLDALLLGDFFSKHSYKTINMLSVPPCANLRFLIEYNFYSLSRRVKNSIQNEPNIILD
jgi:hypothetical protein